MPERNSSVKYSSDLSLTFVDVAGLSELEFGLRGCSGAKIILLKEQNNFTDFLEIILGKDDIQIRQALTDLRTLHQGAIIKLLANKEYIYSSANFLIPN